MVNSEIEAEIAQGRTLRVNLRAVNLLVGVVATTSVVFVSIWGYFSKLLGSKLGLIDDHELLSYLGPDRRIDWLEIPSILSQTEAGDWGESSRFRPGYYLLRILQTKFFLGDAAMWYSSRLFLFGIAVSLIGFAVWLLAGKTLEPAKFSNGVKLGIQFGVMSWVTMSMISLSSWGDIVTRLGPSELYVFLGLSLMCFGLVMISNEIRPWVGSFIANFGFILAVSSKENALLLLLPLVVFVLIQLRRNRFVKVNLFLLFVSSVVGGWVISGVLISISTQGGDIYAGQRTLSGFIQALEVNPQTPLLLGLALIVGILDWAMGQDLSRSGERKGQGIIAAVKVRILSLIALSIILVYFGEVFFYQYALNNSQFMPRYGMISELAVVFVSLLIVFQGLRSLSFLQQLSLASAWKLFPIVVALSVVYGSFATIEGAARSYPVLSEGSAAITAQQMSIIEVMADKLSESPGMQVYIFADKPFDYELVYSLPLFLEYYSGRQVDFYLKSQIPEELKPDGYFQGLADTLDEISQDGGWSIDPLSGFDSEKQTLCIYFGEAVSFDFCTATMGSW